MAYQQCVVFAFVEAVVMLVAEVLVIAVVEIHFDINISTSPVYV